MIPVDPDYIRCDAPEEGAVMGLLGVMTGLSEELFCASWLTGLEHSMWAIREGGPREFGMGQVTERQAQLLLLLSEECDGWWIWDDAKGAVFIRLAAWEQKRSALATHDTGGGG